MYHAARVLVVVLIIVVILLLLLPLTQKVRNGGWPPVNRDNLKQIGLALLNYHDTHGRFPPAAITDKDGKPLLSWRVAILPFIEQEQLYKEFKLDEPWDGPHNRKLLDRMPRIYRRWTDEGSRSHTPYQVFVGPGTIFERPGMTLKDISDGPSSTILLVEASEKVPWTKPADIEFHPDRPLPPLGHPGGEYRIVVLSADGQLHPIRRDLPVETLRAVITRDGGEQVDLSELN